MMSNVQSILYSVVSIKFKFSCTFSLFVCFFIYFFAQSGFVSPLWREAGLGGPGEETVLLDTDDPGHQHPHLLLVEATQHRHLFTTRSSVKIIYHI